MTKLFDVIEMGEISVFLPNEGDPTTTRFRVRVVERSGVEISLEFGPSECQQLWLALEGLKKQYPRAMGVQ